MAAAAEAAATPAPEPALPAAPAPPVAALAALVLAHICLRPVCGQRGDCGYLRWQVSLANIRLGMIMYLESNDHISGGALPSSGWVGLWRVEGFDPWVGCPSS